MKKRNMTWAMLVDGNERFLGWILEEDLAGGKSLEEIVEPPAVTAEPLTAVNEVLSMMFSSALGNLAIIDEDGKLQGVVSFEAIREVLGQQDGRQS
jgi:CBS domain-containing protein